MSILRAIWAIAFYTGASFGTAEAQLLIQPSAQTSVMSADGDNRNSSNITSQTEDVPIPAITFGESAVDRRADAELPLPPVGPTDACLSLEQLERMALATNPAIAQADANVRALRGKWVQVGLPPNPTAGYLGSEIGDEGRAGQQGGYVGQEFVTGGKLRLDRGVVAQEVQNAEQRLAAMQQRVKTDVRRAYYAVLISQRRVEIAEELRGINDTAVKTSDDLLKAQQIPRAGLLQTEVELQNAEIVLQTAHNEQSAAWRKLTAVVGSELAPQRLAGDVAQLPGALNWDEQLLRITSTSPEVAAAMTQVMRAQMELRRARAEPIPNISTQFSVQLDNATNDTIAGVQVGLPLPLWNRNQGGIQQADAEVTVARRNAERVELDLKRRLAATVQSYDDARIRSERYATKILPKAKETNDLVQRGYRLGEISYIDLLTAQRTYSQTNLAYLDALASLWASWAEIEGLLLSESLSTQTDGF